VTTADPTDFEALADAQEAKRLRSEVQAKQATEDLKWLMAHKQGRRLAYAWLADSGIYQNPFNHSGSVTAFNCGRMNLGQQFLARILEHTPDSYLQLLKEHKLDDN
jgi:hypothetical protein